MIVTSPSLPPPPSAGCVAPCGLGGEMATGGDRLAEVARVHDVLLGRSALTRSSRKPPIAWINRQHLLGNLYRAAWTVDGISLHLREGAGLVATSSGDSASGASSVRRRLAGPTTLPRSPEVSRHRHGPHGWSRRNRAQRARLRRRDDARRTPRRWRCTTAGSAAFGNRALRRDRRHR